MLFRSNLIPIMVRYQLRVIFLSIKFYRPLNRPLSLYTFFNNYSINKIQTFIFLFSGGFQSISPCGFKDLCVLKEPLWIQRLFSTCGFKGYFQKQTYFVSCFLEVDVLYFLALPLPASMVVVMVV